MHSKVEGTNGKFHILNQYSDTLNCYMWHLIRKVDNMYVHFKRTQNEHE